jgi:hypothetical protein
MATGGNRSNTYHMPSHAALLPQASSLDAADRAGGADPRRKIDGIVVPTIKPWSLGPAIQLAADVGCALVILCTTARQAVHARRAVQARRACHAVSGEVLVTHIPTAVDNTLFSFETSRHPENASQPGCHVDIARKRNVGLWLARLCGWRTAMFLDDDIRDVTAAAVSGAAALTSACQAAGFTIAQYPDNSVVCHAYRLSGGSQDVFPGGSALVIDVARSDTPFPPIYNEDWLFMFDAVQRRSVTVAGSLSQLEYQPFARPRRAASEEFGDVIAEGLYGLLQEGGTLADATASYWRGALERRSRLIDHITGRLLLAERDTRAAAAALLSLSHARKRLADINDVSCLSFVRSWRTDVNAWHDKLARLAVLDDLPGAARYLDLPVHD